MTSKAIEEYRKAQQLKYERYQNKIRYEKSKKILLDIGYNDNICELILENNLVIKIQEFFRKYRLLDKICFNLQEVINYDTNDIIRFRHGYKVYGFHYLDLIKHFDEEGYSNPFTKLPLELYQLRRINSKIKKLNKFLYTKHSKYYEFNPISFNQSDSWNPAEIYGLFESRGINSVEVPENVFNDMLELPPSLYAVEIISDNKAERSYASFDNFPTQTNVQLPLGIYQQLKILPKDISNLKMRIIEPPKCTELKIRCMISRENLLNDIKGRLTKEINKHKILSLNQIVIVESDINFGMIPFRVEKLEPSNVVNILNVDVEVDFLESMPYEDPMEALLVELNK